MKKTAGMILGLVIAISVPDHPVYRYSIPLHPRPKIIRDYNRTEKPEMILLPAVSVWFT